MGKTVTFEAEISKEGLKVEWYHDTKQIRRDDKHDFKMDGKVHRLIIDKVESCDIGEYRVVYQNLSSTAKLSVEGQYFILLDGLRFIYYFI